MKTLPPSPIQLLEERVSHLRHDKLLAFSAFCAQAAIRNVEVYLTAAKAGSSDLNDKLDSWFWQKLRSGLVDFPYSYREVEEEFVERTEEFERYPRDNNISPPPRSEMASESVFLFIVACSFLAGQGKVSQLLTVIDNCISCKIDFYYRGEIGINIYKSQTRSLPAIYSFPVYGHALIDLEWALTIIERDEGLWISTDTLGLLRAYADNCLTFVVPQPFYYKG
jgi:hypothetical protein